MQYRAKGDSDSDWRLPPPAAHQGDRLQQRGLCGGLARTQPGEKQSWMRTLRQHRQQSCELYVVFFTPHDNQ